MDVITIVFAALVVWHGVVYGINGIIAVCKRRCMMNSEQPIMHVCCYCKSILDEHQNAVTRLSEEEYDALRHGEQRVSHGACCKCSDEQRAELGLKVNHR